VSVFGEHIADPGWLGWDTLGEVDRMESESIVTRFFCFVMPLWPSYSIYLTRSPDGEQRYIRIGRQRRSVVLGYLRFDLWLAAIVLAAAGLSDLERFGSWLYLAAVFAGCAALLQFGAGRLADDERERRMLLRRVSGLGAPPELLPERLRHEIRDQLLDAWQAQSRELWHDAIASGVASELLVALADYHLRPALVERARRSMVESSVDRLRWN
jgi:hypothetical protein